MHHTSELESDAVNELNFKLLYQATGNTLLWNGIKIFRGEIISTKTFKKTHLGSIFPTEDRVWLPYHLYFQFLYSFILQLESFFTGEGVSWKLKVQNDVGTKGFTEFSTRTDNYKLRDLLIIMTRTAIFRILGILVNSFQLLKVWVFIREGQPRHLSKCFPE